MKGMLWPVSLAVYRQTTCIAVKVTIMRMMDGNVHGQKMR